MEPETTHLGRSRSRLRDLGLPEPEPQLRNTPVKSFSHPASDRQIIVNIVWYSEISTNKEFVSLI